MGSVNDNKASPYDLTDKDIQDLARRYIDPETARLNNIYRVDDVEGARIVGYTFRGTDGERYSGLIIQNYRVGFFNHRSERLRRDYPSRVPRTDGPGFKEEKKYLWSKDSRSQFYYPFGNKREHLTDTKIPAYIIEGEFKAIALKRVLTEAGHECLVIGIYGCNNWKGTTGKRADAGGRREDTKGPVNDFEDIEWKGREVVICRDANFRTNPQVDGGMRNLAAFVQLLGSDAFFADTPDLEGVNGLDDLAGLHGPDAVLDVLSAAKRVPKPEQPEREKLTPEQREAQASALREMAGQSTDALAADVLGSSAAKHMLRLWAEAGLTDEAVRLLIAWEALAAGCDDLNYYYAHLYELLYKCDGTHLEETDAGPQAVDASHLEQSPTGARVLKSSCRKKLSERIARAEAEFEQCGISFAYHTPGKLDEFDNIVQSNVKLYTRQFVAECLTLAESLPGYARGKKEARNAAIKQFIVEKSGVAYRRKPPKRKDRSKQIADGWKRKQGVEQATIKRMRDRGDSDDLIAKTALEFTDPLIIDYIERRARGEVDAHFGVTSKQGAKVADSTDDFARFSETCRNPQDKERDSALWDQFLARRQQGSKSPSVSEPTAEMMADADLDSDEWAAQFRAGLERGAAL